MSAKAINLKRLWDEYYGDTSYLNPVKCNTPFEYYDNDPEFVRDAKSCARFVSQRLGSSGLGNTQLNISDLTVYASFEEAVTTYGNLVYQYKIRDSYINIEGSPASPFNNNTVTYVDSTDINAPVTWSAARLATWADADYNPAFSQSVANNKVYVISASVSDFVLPNQQPIVVLQGLAPGLALIGHLTAAQPQFGHFPQHLGQGAGGQRRKLQILQQRQVGLQR